MSGARNLTDEIAIVRNFDSLIGLPPVHIRVCENISGPGLKIGFRISSTIDVHKIIGSANNEKLMSQTLLKKICRGVQWFMGASLLCNSGANGLSGEDGKALSKNIQKKSSPPPSIVSQFKNHTI